MSEAFAPLALADQSREGGGAAGDQTTWRQGESCAPPWPARVSTRTRQRGAAGSSSPDVLSDRRQVSMRYAWCAHVRLRVRSVRGLASNHCHTVDARNCFFLARHCFYYLVSSFYRKSLLLFFSKCRQSLLLRPRRSPSSQTLVRSLATFLGACFIRDVILAPPAHFAHPPAALCRGPDFRYGWNVVPYRVRQGFR